MAHVLQIYVDRECSTCEEARRLARELAAAFPDLRVELIDLSESDQIKPPDVFAVPTFLLDRKVISLGNPDPAELAARLSSLAPG